MKGEREKVKGEKVKGKREKVKGESCLLLVKSKKLNKMKIGNFLVGLFLFFGSIALAQSITSKKDSIMYAMGLLAAEDLKKGGLEKVDKKILLKAIDDYFSNKNSMPIEAATVLVKKYKTEVNAKAGRDYLSNNAKRKEVTVLPSGLQYEVMKAATLGGEKPKFNDKVRAHYHGTTIDGKVFDSSVNRGQPFNFGCNQVIRGWQEAVQLMSIGDKWKLYIPYELAYGERGSGSIPPYSTLIFEVELLEINPK